MDEYEKVVHSNFQPKISHKKKAQLEKLIESLKTSPRQSKPFQGNNVSVSVDLEEARRYKVHWPENPLKPKPKPRKEARVVDWLKEQRAKQGDTIRSRA
jgi:hypothetical protein